VPSLAALRTLRNVPIDWFTCRLGPAQIAGQPAIFLTRGAVKELVLVVDRDFVVFVEFVRFLAGTSGRSGSGRIGGRGLGMGIGQGRRERAVSGATIGVGPGDRFLRDALAVQKHHRDHMPGLEPAFIDDQTVAFLGSSGVGKSTLINRLLGRHTQRTGGLRSDGKGRHTTTTRSLFARPGGGLVLDTPGMRELQLWEGSAGHESAFADVEDFTGNCRFRDCSHTTEPGCAVLEAVRAGELSQERWESYHKLRREIAYLESKNDPQARDDRNRGGKVRNKAADRWIQEKRKW
jgi:RsgA GTPase